MGCVWLADLLGGHTPAVSVCLTQLAPEIRESLAAIWAETIVLYLFKWTNRLCHPLWRHQPTNLPCKERLD